MNNIDKEVRGQIVAVLSLRYPEPMQFRALHSVLNTPGMGPPLQMSDLRQHLAYLEEKEYVEITQDEGDKTRIKIESAACTAKGHDLAKGYITDVGVLV